MPVKRPCILNSSVETIKGYKATVLDYLEKNDHVSLHILRKLLRRLHPLSKQLMVLMELDGTVESRVVVVNGQRHIQYVKKGKSNGV